MGAFCARFNETNESIQASRLDCPRGRFEATRGSGLFRSDVPGDNEKQAQEHWNFQCRNIEVFSTDPRLADYRDIIHSIISRLILRI